MSSNLRISNEWKHLLQLPNYNYGYKMVAIGNDQIAIVGGKFIGESFDNIDICNLKTKKWSTYRMKHKRTECAAVAIYKKIFIFGGYNIGNEYFSSCEMLDLNDKSRKTKFLPSMSEEKTDFPAVVYNKTNVIVLGGDGGRYRTLSTVEMFDIIKNKWIKLPSMRKARKAFAAGVAGSHVIVVGGINDETVEILDMKRKDKKWKKMASMNHKRQRLCGAVIDCSMSSFYMVVTGGLVSDNQSQSCMMYHFNNDEWSNNLPDIKSKSPRRQLIVMNNHGMLIAGGNECLEYLTFTTPNHIYKLVQFAVELDSFLD